MKTEDFKGGIISKERKTKKRKLADRSKALSLDSSVRRKLTAKSREREKI
jgi:hypothetical protein